MESKVSIIRSQSCWAVAKMKHVPAGIGRESRCVALFWMICVQEHLLNPKSLGFVMRKRLMSWASERRFAVRSRWPRPAVEWWQCRFQIRRMSSYLSRQSPCQGIKAEGKSRALQLDESGEGMSVHKPNDTYRRW